MLPWQYLTCLNTPSASVAKWLWWWTNDPRVVGLRTADSHTYVFYLVDEVGNIGCATCCRKCMCILPMEMRICHTYRNVCKSQCSHVYNNSMMVWLQIKIHVTPNLTFKQGDNDKNHSDTALDIVWFWPKYQKYSVWYRNITIRNMALGCTNLILCFRKPPVNK